jgi:hypothetical protein
MGPVVAAYEVEASRERRIVIAYKQGGTRSFFSALSDLYHSYNFYSTRKYVGAFGRDFRELESVQADVVSQNRSRMA